jgi:hypothetical protein
MHAELLLFKEAARDRSTGGMPSRRPNAHPLAVQPVDGEERSGGRPAVERHGHAPRVAMTACAPITCLAPIRGSTRCIAMARRCMSGGRGAIPAPPILEQPPRAWQVNDRIGASSQRREALGRRERCGHQGQALPTHRPARSTAPRSWRAPGTSRSRWSPTVSAGRWCGRARARPPAPARGARRSGCRRTGWPWSPSTGVASPLTSRCQGYP